VGPRAVLDAVVKKEAANTYVTSPSIQITVMTLAFEFVIVLLIYIAVLKEDGYLMISFQN
jgi:hypothetical protein